MIIKPNYKFNVGQLVEYVGFDYHTRYQYNGTHPKPGDIGRITERLVYPVKIKIIAYSVKWLKNAAIRHIDEDYLRRYVEPM